MMTTTTTRHVTTVLGLSVLGLATLTGCSTEEQGTDTSANAPAEQSADSGTEANNQNAGADVDDQVEENDQSDSDDQDDDASSANDSNGTAESEDAVFGVIDAALNEYSDGVVIAVDREDSGASYEVDVVSSGALYELVITPEGQVTETEQDDGDDDDTQKAEQATVTAAEAAQQVLQGRDDEAIVDELELDEDDDQLRWDVDLDDTNGQDLAEETVPAN